MNNEYLTIIGSSVGQMLSSGEDTIGIVPLEPTTPAMVETPYEVNPNTGAIADAPTAPTEALVFEPVSGIDLYYLGEKYEGTKSEVVSPEWADAHAGIHAHDFKITNAADSATPITSILLQDGEERTLYVIGRAVKYSDGTDAGEWEGTQFKIRNDGGTLTKLSVNQKWISGDFTLANIKFTDLKKNASRAYGTKLERLHLDHVFVKQPITEGIILSALQDTYGEA